MPSSIYFQSNYKRSSEQDLLDQLTVEAAQIHGMDCYYCPRNYGQSPQANLYREDDQSYYNTAILTELVLENVLGFQGDGQFLSKFAGVEIRDQIIFTIPRLTWDNNVRSITGSFRPNEGDIIYWPEDNRTFIIRNVDKYSVMYQLGKLYQWRLTCELFEYSNEILNTGIEGIDSLQQTASTNLYDWAMLDTNGDILEFEDGSVWAVDSYSMTSIDPEADNDLVQQQGSNTIVDWTQEDPYEDGGEIKKYL